MSIILNHTCVVFDFENVDFNSQVIYEKFSKLIQEILLDNDLVLPNDWTLIYNVGYTNGRIPLVSKNKIGNHKTDKIKQISVIIPIPLKSEIKWGVNAEQHLYTKDHYDKLMKNFMELDINYNDYLNRSDYIAACLKAGIRKSFEEGFTVGGVKIKANKTVEI